MTTNSVSDPDHYLEVFLPPVAVAHIAWSHGTQQVREVLDDFDDPRDIRARLAANCGALFSCLSSDGGLTFRIPRAEHTSGGPVDVLLQYGAVLR